MGLLLAKLEMMFLEVDLNRCSDPLLPHDRRMPSVLPPWL